MPAANSRNLKRKKKQILKPQRNNSLPLGEKLFEYPGFLIRSHENWEEVAHFSNAVKKERKKKTCQAKTLCWKCYSKHILQGWRETGIFLGERKLREFVTSQSTLKEPLTDILEQKGIGKRRKLGIGEGKKIETNSKKKKKMGSACFSSFEFSKLCI